MKKEKQESDAFNYFSICEKCPDEECCTTPYFTFIARNEIEKIQEKIRDFPKKYQNFLEADVISYQNAEHQWYGIKKVKDRCIFLEGRRTCLIHEVKPLHCKCYPLVWGYEEEGNKLFIYIDAHPACNLVPILSKNNEWIETMKKYIVMEVQKMSIIDRIAYNSLESDDTLRMIDVIDLP